jgi:hypothetical protein
MQQNEVVMPRRASHASKDGQRWFRALETAQRKVERAEWKRNELARQALEHGLSAHSVAEALNIDPATAWRRYASKGGR